MIDKNKLGIIIVGMFLMILSGCSETDPVDSLYVQMIQGDGIDRRMVDSILNAIIQHGFSPDNLAFGSGGGLLRKHDRDSKQFAFKCSHAIVNGEERDIWKSPVTSHSKKSKRSRLALINEETIH